jgi:luciferase family oxidoreductase group 1
VKEDEIMSTKQLRDVKLSVLDLSPVLEGETPRDSFRNTLDLAKHVENLGYHRFWLAEHHNMEGIASSATSVLISQVASVTSTMRVGSGGIMLPNHSPLVIAEHFGTLETLFPGRIDLGLGRAPGTDQLTAYALRRGTPSNGEDFPQQLEELREYFDPTRSPGKNRVRAIPGEGLSIPIWLLGSSGFSARLAGELGLPFSFASHFSPENTLGALDIYRRSFRPSEVLQKPYAMVAVNVFAAESDEIAEYLSTSMQQSFLGLIRNKPGKVKPPVDSMEGLITPYEKTLLEQRLGSNIVGSPETVKNKLESFVRETDADEVMINSQIFDHHARLRSYEIISEIAKNN